MTQHVAVRGNGRRAIFLDESDREAFLLRLQRVLPEAGVCCFAWALLSNHAHLVLRSSRVRLASAMASINTSYAIYFNRRHGHVGHLFQERFGSRPVLDDDDLAGVIVYVAGNPLRHAVVGDEDALREHAWSCYGALVGERAPRGFHSLEAALRVFGDDPSRARSTLRRLVADRAHVWARPGSPDATSLISGDEEPEEAGDLVREVCRSLAVSPTELRTGRRSRHLSEARAQIAEVAVRRGWPLGSLAAMLGVSVPALSQAARRRRERSLPAGGLVNQ